MSLIATSGLVAIATVTAIAAVKGYSFEQVAPHIIWSAILLSGSMALAWRRQRRDRDDHLVWEEVPPKRPHWMLQPGDLPPVKPLRSHNSVEPLPIIRDVNDKALSDE